MMLSSTGGGPFYGHVDTTEDALRLIEVRPFTVIIFLAGGADHRVSFLPPCAILRNWTALLPGTTHTLLHFT